MNLPFSIMMKFIQMAFVFEGVYPINNQSQNLIYYLLF